MRLFASLLFLLILSTPSWATTYYVRPDGAGTVKNTQTSLVTPHGAASSSISNNTYAIYALYTPLGPNVFNDSTINDMVVR